MRAARTTRWTAAVVGFGLLAAACGSGSSNSSSSDSTAGAGANPASTSGMSGECTADKVGGSITMGMHAENAGMDPAVSAGYGVSGGIETAAVFDRLMRWDPNTGGWQPQVAQSLTPNSDFTVWTLKLRDNVKFGNGDPLTTEAVKATIERYRSDQTKSGVRLLAAQAGEMAIVDPLTMTFTLPSPWPGFPTLLSDEAGQVVNPKVVASMDPTAFNANPKGAGVGPYEVERFSPGSEIVLRAKKDYWGGPVCIEQLRFVAMPNPTAKAEAFKLGEMDMVFMRDPRVVAQVRADGVGGFPTLFNMGEAILINNGQKGAQVPTTDVRLRQALGYAINPQMLADRAWEGTGLATTGILAEPSLYFDPASAGPRYDPAEARKLVEQVKAGGWDGSLRLVCADRPEFDLALQAMLQDVGITVRMDNTLSTADAITKVRVNGDYDIACWGLSADDADLWRRLNDNVGSKTNRVGYVSPEMDVALARLRGAQGVDATKSVMREVQKVWNETMPAVPVAGMEEVVFWNDKVRGLVPTSKAVVLFGDAYLER